MTSHTLETQLSDYIRSKRDEGILDECFEIVKGLQNKDDQHFVAQLIQTYIPEAENCISQVSNCLRKTRVEFEAATHAIHKLKGSTSCLGGRKMADACRALRTACENRQYFNCVEELARMREEFAAFKDCLTEIAQMERRIYDYYQGNQT